METISRRAWPITPIALGLSGLIPFVALSLIATTRLPAPMLDPDRARAALMAYGAVIASFLGGIRWGVALKEGGRTAAMDVVAAVAPSLIGWFALALPRPFDALALGALLLAWGAVDQDLPRRGLAPAWFGRLRIALSGIAGASVLATAAFA